jgi:hypothetical protein
LYGLRLSPNDPRAHGFLGHLALVQYHQGNYEDAARSAERALSRGRWPVALRILLAILGQLGRTEEAGKAREELERIKLAEPERYWESTICHADPTHQAHLLEGLRKASMQV